MSEVLDFRKIAADRNSAVAGVSRVEGYDWPVYKIDKRPGKSCRSSFCSKASMSHISSLWIYFRPGPSLNPPLLYYVNQYRS